MKKDEIINLVISGMNTIISERDDTGQIHTDNYNESTQLLGPGSDLDSLGVVSLLAYVELKLNEDRNISITIADERAMSLEKSPFKTVQSLVEYIEFLINEQ